MEVEFATAVAARAANAALDAELAAKMTKYDVINEETAAVRKKRDAFRSHGESTLSSAKRPQTVVPKVPDLKLLKKIQGRKLSIGLLFRDGGKKGMRKPPSNHMSLPPVINATIRRRMAWVEAHFIFSKLYCLFFTFLVIFKK
uniref:Uncharacterized protein n=1 Tax=Solanum tuberosum TaxID=4113 RepID=M1DGG4_SOLTU